MCVRVPVVALSALCIAALRQAAPCAQGHTPWPARRPNRYRKAISGYRQVGIIDKGDKSSEKGALFGKIRNERKERQKSKRTQKIKKKKDNKRKGRKERQ